MKTKKTIFTLMLAISLLIPAATFPVYAEDVRGTQDEVRVSPSPRTNTPKPIQSCEVTQERIAMRIAVLETRRDALSTRYTKVRELLASMVDRLESKGVDLGPIRAALDILKAKIDVAVNKEYREVIALLKEFSGEVCTLTPVEKKAKIEVIKVQIAEAQAAKTDIHTYFKETIVPLLKALIEAQKNDRAN